MYLMWIPLLIVSIFFMSYLSCKSDESWKWFGYLFITGALLQFWPWVARYSKQIVFDAILFDSIAVIVWTFSLLFWSGQKFSISQWVGTVIVLMGLITIQKG